MRFASLLLSMSMLPLLAHATSFDCAKKSTDTEWKICKDDTLGSLDSLVADAYAQLVKLAAPGDLDHIRQAQRTWLIARDRRCSDKYDCIEALATRLLTIKKEISPLLLSMAVSKYDNMNQLIWNDEFEHFIHVFFGDLRGNEWNREYFVSAQASNFLGGPPEPLQKMGNIVVGSACRAHSCDEKGIVVFDTVTRDALFGLVSFTDAAGIRRTESTVLVYYRNKQFLATHHGLLEKYMNQLAGQSKYLTVLVPSPSPAQ